MGTLVTLELPAGSPVRDLPWIITIGPLAEVSDDWEPVVCGPYERPHALALAESVVADDELLAVVEPLLPLTTPEAIRDDLESVRAAAEATDRPDDEDEPRRALCARPPTEDEVRAGFARIAAALTGG